MPANLYLPFDDPKNYWGQFMYKLASRYASQINYWVIWNEPDLYDDKILYTWDGSISDMYQLVKVAYLAVKKANPNAKDRPAGPDLLEGQGKRPPAVSRALSWRPPQRPDRRGQR